MKNNRILLRLTAVLAAAMVALAGTPACAKTTKTSTAASIATQTGVTIPAYSGNPFAAVNNNVPYFTKADLTTTPFELYSDLDDLGRCGTAYANVCQDLMQGLLLILRHFKRQGIRPGGNSLIRENTGFLGPGQIRFAADLADSQEKPQEFFIFSMGGYVGG